MQAGTAIAGGLESVPALRIKGLKHQTALWRYEPPPGKLGQAAIVGPLGCGKSFGLAVEAYLLAIANKGHRGVLVVPTYNLFRAVHRVEWPAIFLGWGIPLRHRPSDEVFIWPWGDELWVRSAEKPERIVAANYAYGIIDEPGQMKRDAYDRTRARIRSAGAPKRMLALGGTPEGLNYFADVHQNPVPPVATFFAREWHKDMAHYPEELRQTFGYDESLFAAYGEGRFVPMRVGRAYRQYDPAVHRTGDGRVSPHLPLVVSCDFNVDFMRWTLWQIYTDEIRCVGEIALGRGGHTAAACGALLDMIEDWPIRKCVVTGDVSGKARSTSGKSDYRIVREELSPRFESLRFRLPNENPRHKDSVEAVNYHLAARGGRRIIIPPSAVELDLDLQRVVWLKGRPELDKSDEERTHASDTLRYLIWNLAKPGYIGARARTGIVRARRHAAFGAW